MPALIEITALRKTYGRGQVRALDGVDLAIAEGARFGLLGPNGAGKTTLLAILLGLTRKDAGSVRVAGLDPDREIRAVRRVCALAPQDLGFYPQLTVAENLKFHGWAGGLAGAKLTERTDFAVATTQLAEHLAKLAGDLSGGLKRRLNLALSLLHEPRVLCLDEPTVGVDPQSRAFILEAIRGLANRGTTIVYTSHYMEEVQELCDTVAVLDRGRVLAQGSVADLRASGRTLEDVFLSLTGHGLRD